MGRWEPYRGSALPHQGFQQANQQAIRQENPELVEGWSSYPIVKLPGKTA